MAVNLSESSVEKGLSLLYKNVFGKEPVLRKLKGGGSSRSYYRLESPQHDSVIGVYGSDRKENEAFLNLDRLFASEGINVPEILAVSDDREFYLLQDLGDEDLLSRFETGDKINLAKQALEELVKLQNIPEEKWEKKVGFSEFGERLVKWDLNYFKYEFLKPCGVFFDEDRLEDDFEKLTDLLTRSSLELKGFMYRDFQSRNIMWHDGRLWFIDFQGGRKGPVVYDAVSFLWQSRAPFTFEEREESGRFYAGLMEKERKLNPGQMEKEILPMALFRTLQVLGAYGFRGLIERKPLFLKSIPKAIGNLMYLKDKGVLNDLPELSLVAERISNLDFSRYEEKEPEGLTVKVYSFSYKKGYPEDVSGNGGGFMFDCRGLPNPGRYDEYKKLTGRDREVIEFLEEKEEVKTFIENAWQVVRPSVKVYNDRGFTSLQVGFGCTGGQHRSVYSAEHFAERLKKEFPEITVHLIHREQGITEKSERSL